MEDQSRNSILIVDDEKAHIEVLIHILKAEYTIFVAKSGEAALEMANRSKLDLILLDVIMPDMSGFDVLVQLKESNITKNIPVIFITKLAKTEDEERGFVLGAVDYITKPFKNSIVRARIRTHMKLLKQMRTVERLGMMDALTDIPNRRSFDNTIALEWQNALENRSPISMLMIDMDKFKSYNDTYGHPQGDLLLQKVARIMRDSLSDPTFVVARIGGEEFAIILPNTNLTVAAMIAEQIRSTVADVLVYDGYSETYTSVTVSIGVATATPTPDTLPQDLILASDQALYTAKNLGRNRVSLQE